MTPQHRNYKASRKKIEDICEHKENYVLIWYSVENVNEMRRITSIVIQSLSGQIRTFSTNFEAGFRREEFTNTTANYDKCEKQMLKDFYEYAEKQCTDKIWLHWRMKLAEYGFTALENRYKYLGGKPFVISDNNKIDICELFKCRYGGNFVNKNNDRWRIKYLAEKNSIETAGFLGHIEEEHELKKKQYERVLISLSRKTNIVTQFLDLSYKSKLKTDSKWQEIYGITPQGIYDACKETWWFNLLIFVLGIIIGFLIK